MILVTDDLPATFLRIEANSAAVKGAGNLSSPTQFPEQVPFFLWLAFNQERTRMKRKYLVVHGLPAWAPEVSVAHLDKMVEGGRRIGGPWTPNLSYFPIKLNHC